MAKLFYSYIAFIEWWMRFMSNGYQHDLVYKKQVELLYLQIPLVVSAVLVISSVLVILFSTEQNQLQAMIWLISVYIFSIIRLYFYFKWSKGKSSISTHHWAQMGVNFSLVSGFQWAATTLIFFNNNSVIDAAILTLVLLAMISAAVGSSSVIPAAFAAYTAPITVFLFIALLNTENTDYHVFAYLLIVYITASSLFCRNTYKSNMHGIRLSIENIDLVKKLQTEKEKAETANIAKSKFLASASHDLRQPLQSMTLFTEALKENLKEPDNLKLANRITNSHDALSELLNALLDISKLDAGGVEVQNTSFDIAQMINELHLEFQPLVSQKNQQMAISKSSHIIYSDPIITKRILQNLIANAIHYSPVEAMIIIETKIQNKHLLINIKDNGPGIPINEQKHIFTEFYQLNNPERDRNKGLGLGLAIVKRLTILLNSKIKLESSMGSGCNFSFELPLATSEQLAEKQKTPQIASVTSLTDKQILLVEDEIDVREALAMTLKNWGCTIWQTDNIAGALAFINQQDIDFIVTDYRLREHETGIDLLKEIHKVNAGIPGLIITGDTGTEQIQEFLQAGHIVLHKPIKPAELRMAIQQSVKAI